MEAERVREIWDYDPDTGILRWKINVSRWLAGYPAGNPKRRKDGKSYVFIRFEGKWFLAHRLAFAWMTGRWPEQLMDHVNGVETDNRWVNLREATFADNARNRRLPRTNSTGYRGVFEVIRFGKVGYEARIKVNGKAVELGRFKTKQEAHAAYCTAQQEYHGTFATLRT